MTGLQLNNLYFKLSCITPGFICHVAKLDVISWMSLNLSSASFVA